MPEDIVKAFSQLVARKKWHGKAGPEREVDVLCNIAASDIPEICSQKFYMLTSHCKNH